MMKRSKTWFSAVIAVIALTACMAVACKNEPTPSLTLDQTSLSLYVGDTHTLSAQATAIDGTLEWNTSDAAVISVTPSEDGKSAVLTALKVGEADITVSANGISAICAVVANAINKVPTIEIRYDGDVAPAFKKGATLELAKLSAVVSSAELDYRYTIRFGDGEEQDLTGNYTFAESGVYTVTAYIDTHGYEGHDTLTICVANDELTDITVSYGGEQENLYTGDTFEFASLSAASVSHPELQYVYTVTLPDGTAQDLTADFTYTLAGMYTVKAQVSGSEDWIGAGTLTLTVNATVDVTDSIAVTYGGSPAEDFEIAMSGDTVSYDLSQFAASVNGHDDVTAALTWTLDGDPITLAEADNYTFSEVGAHVLQVEVTDKKGYIGKKSVAFTVYKNYTLAITGADYAIVNKNAVYAVTGAPTADDAQTLLEISYDDGQTFSRFVAPFTQAGNAKLRARVAAVGNLHRGSVVKNVTVCEIGTEYAITPATETLLYGLTQTASGVAFDKNTVDVTDKIPDSTTASAWLALSDAVTVTDGTVTGVKAGAAEVYAVIGGSAYSVAEITVKDYTGYKAIANLQDINAVTNDAAGKYVLVNGIDLNGRTGAIATDFTGVFDGNGYALKNGIIHYNGSNQGENEKKMTAFHGETSGAVYNLAFIGWQMTGSAQQTTGSQFAFFGNVNAKARIENIYIDTTVAVQPRNGGGSCAVLRGANGNADSMKNIIVNVRFDTSKMGNNPTDFGTIHAEWATGALTDCYAIVSGIDAATLQFGNANVSYSSLAALQDAKPDLFKTGGVFTGAFWDMCKVDICRPIFKVGNLQIFEGETFAERDIFVNIANRAEVAISSEILTFADGTFAAGSVSVETDVTLTIDYYGEQSTMTVTVKPLVDVSDTATLTYTGITPYAIGSVFAVDDFRAQYNGGDLAVDEFRVQKEGGDAVSADGYTFESEGTYTILATVTARGYKGTVSCSFEIKRPVSVTSSIETADLVVYPTQTVSGAAYSDITKKTVQLNVTAAYSDGAGEAITEFTYSSKNTAIATVDSRSGLVTAVSGGSVEIWVTVNGGNYKVCTVTVTDYSDYKAIADKADIEAIAGITAENSNNYLLVNDVDLEGRVGLIFKSAYKGIFDGNGYALKNGTFMGHKTKSATDLSYDAGGTNTTMTVWLDMFGTIRNVAFVGWEVKFDGANVNASGSQSGLIANVKGGATVENVFMSVTVNGDGYADSWTRSNGALFAHIDGTNSANTTIRNVIVNAGYTGNYTLYAAVAGSYKQNARIENCYAILGQYADTVNSYFTGKEWNVASIEALRTAHPNLFAEGGAFATEFFSKQIVVASAMRSARVVHGLAAANVQDVSATLQVAAATVGGVAQTVTFTSSDTAVATVNALGVITAVGDGVAKIYASINGVTYWVCNAESVNYSDYTVIKDVAGLKAMTNGKYILANDIDMNSVAGRVVAKFEGILEGNGHCIRNVLLQGGGSSVGEEYRQLFGEVYGTIRNIAFIDCRTGSETNTTWRATGIIGNIKSGATVENIYIQMTVNCNGQNNCNGILTGYCEGNNRIRNIIIDATYTGEYTKFGTVMGGNQNTDNVYAIVNGDYASKIPCKCDNPNNKEWNYASLTALQDAKPDLFKAGGVFAGVFWSDILSGMQG